MIILFSIKNTTGEVVEASTGNEMQSSKIWKDKAEEMGGGSEGGKGIENAGWKKRVGS